MKLVELLFKKSTFILLFFFLVELILLVSTIKLVLRDEFFTASLIFTIPLLIFYFILGFFNTFKYNNNIIEILFKFISASSGLFLSYIAYTVFWAIFIDIEGDILTEIRLGGTFNLFIFWRVFLYSIPTYLLSNIIGLFSKSIKRK